jgi:hypothetical protein
MTLRDRITRFLAACAPKGLRQILQDKLITEIESQLRGGFKADVKSEIAAELKEKLKAEIKAELDAERSDALREEFAKMAGQASARHLVFLNTITAFKSRINKELSNAADEIGRHAAVERLSIEWRIRVRDAAGLPGEVPQPLSLSDLIQEMRFLMENQELLTPVFKLLSHKRVLFAGQAYYNGWYLSRALRQRGWKADALNWDLNPDSQIYYHGEDFSFDAKSECLTEQMLAFYLASLYAYDVFHFSNAFGICFGFPLQSLIEQQFTKYSEIILLKALGKKLVYSNNGCSDGVSQTAFSQWGPESVCSICRWRNEPSVCSDERNLDWGKFRNSVADYQCLSGGNRADYNDDPTVHEVPEFYCLDPDFWHPNIQIPDNFCLPVVPKNTVRLYHAVGNKAERTSENGVNIKSSHVYLPLIQRLKDDGLALELIEPTGIPNKDVRFLQLQADIFLEMLTYGWFGANAREAMLLGKPVICYIRPEWLESVRQEIPAYADELPIISATPETVEAILRDLIAHPDKRNEIGKRSREFVMKWHSSETAAKRFDEIYNKLLDGDPQLRNSI